ncbi:nuclear transport factor 2 family protein [Thalassolituus oleivorans]|uniref:nuclear transport factor 2 family protein n=1 Tax=Thalassolituus oleivorans TaxID=187493 RepID=UPI00240A7628|nr:nuclear transport factor 2 family protein [Thalassolituus oleivorans]MDF1642508.1 nuclear transport factor 2 family protein [Thalassolituus oleivorans]
MSENLFEELRQYISSLESALNAHDAAAYNKYFRSDISWGNPNGGLSSSLADLHPVHKEFLEGPLKNSEFKYTIERIELIAHEVAYAHVRLTRFSESEVIESDERCLYLFSRKNEAWWLCAGHNTRIKASS